LLLKDDPEYQAYRGYALLDSFKKRVEKSKQIISEALEIGDSYVAISWGKDSTVMLHLCQQIKPDIAAVCYSSIEQDYVSNYSETISRYCEKFPTKYLDIKAQKENAATSDTVQDRINAVVDYSVAFVGLRAEESINRRRSLKKYGLIHQYQTGKHKGYYRVCPLAWWSWQDVWAYLFYYDIPYLDLYDKLDRKTSRTNAHANYWYSANKNKSLQKTSLENMKRFNPMLYSYLKQNVTEAFYDC